MWWFAADSCIFCIKLWTRGRYQQWVECSSFISMLCLERVWWYVSPFTPFNLHLWISNILSWRFRQVTLLNSLFTEVLINLNIMSFLYCPKSFSWLVSIIALSVWSMYVLFVCMLILVSNKGWAHTNVLTFIFHCTIHMSQKQASDFKVTHHSHSKQYICHVWQFHWCSIFVPQSIHLQPGWAIFLNGVIWWNLCLWPKISHCLDQI